MDFPELIVARVDLTSKGKLVYLRMEESATEVWLKVELVHWVMDYPKAKENLLRRMNRATGDRKPPEKFGTELKLVESQFTLKTIIRVLEISERHVRRLYRGKFHLKRAGRYSKRPEARIMEKNLSMKLWTRSRM